jgi:glycosyltransferase involved in cell wall biosynthesis
VARLRDESPELYDKVAFILIGDGPTRQQLEAMKVDLGLDNVRFMGLLPREIVFAVLKRSFGTLVTLCPRPDIHTVPSKLYEAMATGRPVLLSAEGEPAEILRNAGGGTVCRPGEAQDLTDALVAYLRDPQTADAHGEAGRRYCEKHFDREDLARQYAKILVELTRSGTGSPRRS